MQRSPRWVLRFPLKSLLAFCFVCVSTVAGWSLLRLGGALLFLMGAGSLCYAVMFFKKAASKSDSMPGFCLVAGGLALAASVAFYFTGIQAASRFKNDYGPGYLELLDGD